MDFKQFKQNQQNNFRNISDGQDWLFVADVDKDELWSLYLDSFPAGTNEVFRERREFDCSCCRHFIKQFGNVVFIQENKLQTIWDFVTGDDKYDAVTSVLSEYVKSKPVCDVFVTKDAIFGTDKNHEQMADGTVHTWHHFRVELPSRFVTNSHKTVAALQSEYRDTRNVFKRSLDEISQYAIETVLDLIAEKTLYRGEEWQGALTQFLSVFNEYQNLPDGEKENFCWIKSVELGGTIGRIRNHSIGVLLQDITNNVEIDEAVRRYESIMAPANYKRPKAIFTKKMVEQAEAEVQRLGLLDSLGRRHAQLNDISINNVIWANKDAAKHMGGQGGVFDVLKQEVAVNVKSFEHAPGVSIANFVNDILPQTSNLQILVENRHENNFMSLIAPENKDAKSLFKWDNGFSWAYNGNIADSMKQRVKAAGGNVNGVLRFSLQWNDNYDNRNDYDAHCHEPNGNHIYYPSKRQVHRSSGMLDVDIIHPDSNQVAVENIVWTDLHRMPEGIYTMNVRCYSHRGGRSGFDAEIEFNGQIYEFAYHKDFHDTVTVAKVRFTHRNGFEIIESLPSSFSTKEIWGIKTNQFQPVSTFMYSPNFWDGQGVGNQHWFFMLVGCQNPDRPNGFFNEYLTNELTPHRKVFEALGGKMKVDYAEDQLSGIGFSSTVRNSVICKADDNIIRIIF